MMRRKKSQLGLCHRKSAPLLTRQLRLFSGEFSTARSTVNRPSRTVERKSRIPLLRSLRHLSLESDERIPSRRRSRSAFATPDTPCWNPQYAMSTQRKQVCTPMSAAGSIQPWLSTSRKSGKAMREKNELAEMVDKIQVYFTCQEFTLSHTIPTTGLQQTKMTLNLFVSLTSHLLSFYYPRHGITMKNYIEKIPQMVKDLGYTGNVSKSWLRTANTMHAWPHLLRLLSWLVNLAEVKNTLIANMLDAQEADADITVNSKELLDYYLDTYIFWDQEQMDDVEVATSQLEEKFNAGLCTEEELKALSEEVDQIKQRLQCPKGAEQVAEETLFQQIKAEHDAVEEEVTKLLSEVASNDDDFSSLKQQLLDISLQLEQLGKEKEKEQQLLQQKEVQLSTQKVSLEEKILFDKKRSSLQMDVDNLDACKCKSMEEMCAKELEVSCLLRNVAEEKEKFCKKLQDIDPKAQEMLRNKCGVSQEETLQLLDDMISNVKSKVSKLNTQQSASASQLEELKTQLSGNEQLEEELSQIKVLQASNEKHEQKLQRREDEHMFESQQLENKFNMHKSAAHSEELAAARAKLEAGSKELEEVFQEFRANNARKILKIMTKAYADFEKLRKKVAERRFGDDLNL